MPLKRQVSQGLSWMSQSATTDRFLHERRRRHSLSAHTKVRQVKHNHMDFFLRILICFFVYLFVLSFY